MTDQIDTVSIVAQNGKKSASPRKSSIQIIMGKDACHADNQPSAGQAVARGMLPPRGGGMQQCREFK